MAEKIGADEVEVITMAMTGAGPLCVSREESSASD